jgi:hypothetical protein
MSLSTMPSSEGIYVGSKVASQATSTRFSTKRLRLTTTRRDIHTSNRDPELMILLFQADISQMWNASRKTFRQPLNLHGLRTAEIVILG